ncbi:YDG domain-containing protein, partial [Sphaerochaeta sp.]
VDGEVVTVTAHPVYQDRHSGTGKLINVSYTLGGTHAGNYRAPANANFVGEITPKALEVSGTSVQLSKVYDGSTTAVVTASGCPSNLVSGDAVTVHAQASYDSADANEGKTLTVTYSISGTDAKNYTAPAPSTYGSTGTITKRQLTVTVGNHTKIYGQENPSFTVNVSGFVNGESASTAGGYVAPTASTAATTTTDTGTYEISTSGGSATNYSFNTSDTGTLTINKATYDMSAISFTDKTVTYNGT